MESLRLATSLWHPKGKLNLALGNLAFNFNWEGGVEGSLNSGSDELLGQWGDDTTVGLDLSVVNWDELGRNLWKNVTSHWGHGEGSLEGQDMWHGRGGHDWETGLSNENVGGIEDLEALNLIEFHVKARLELHGHLFKGLHNNSGVQVSGVLDASKQVVVEAEWGGQLPGLELQLLSNLDKLLLDGWSGDLLSGEEVQVLLQKEVHTEGIGGELSWDLHDVGWAVVVGLNGELVWDQRLLGVDQLEVPDDEGPQVLDEGGDVKGVRVLDAIDLGLDEWQQSPSLVRDGLQLWDLGVSQGTNSGDNEGPDLLRRLGPGADSQLLELSGSWDGEWQNRDSGDPDLGRLDWVQGNGQKDWANLSWVHDGDTLQSIDSNGPASNDVVDLGWSRSLKGSGLDDLDKGLQSLKVTSLAQSKDGSEANMLRLSPLNLLNEVWDVLLSENSGLLGTKNSEDPGWEVVLHGDWADVSMVEEAGQLKQGGSVQLLVGLDRGRLDHLDQLLQQLLSWVPDVANSKGNNLSKARLWKGALLDPLDDEHSGWVGSNKGENVIEDLLHGLHVGGPGNAQNLRFQLLQLGDVQTPHVHWEGAQLASNVRLGGAGLWRLVDLTGHLLDLLQDMWDDLLLVQVHQKVVWGLVQRWLWKQGLDSKEFLRLLGDFQADVLLANDLTVNSWETIDKGLDNPGGGWERHARGDWLGLKQEHVDLRLGNSHLVSLVTKHFHLSNPLVVSLANNELIEGLSADERSGGGHSIANFAGDVVIVDKGVPGVHLEVWRLGALLQVLGLGDHVVWLALADSLRLRQLEVLDQGLLGPPGRLKLVDLPLWQLVDGVLSEALTLNRLLLGGEERHLLGSLLSNWQLDVVGLNLAGSSDVHLELGEDRLLDVGDGSWLVLGNQERLNHTSLQVSNKWLSQEALELLSEGLWLDRLVGLPHDTLSLREPDVLAVDGKELWLRDPEVQGVVGAGLDIDLGVHLDTRPVRLADFWDSGQDLGLVVVNHLLAWSPSIVVQGVGVHRGNNQQKSCQELHGPSRLVD